MFSLTRFFWLKSKQEIAPKQEVKTYKNCKKNLQILNQVFERLISKPFSNSRPISSLKFVVDFYLWRVFCTTKCTFSNRENREVIIHTSSIRDRGSVQSPLLHFWLSFVEEPLQPFDFFLRPDFLVGGLGNGCASLQRTCTNSGKENRSIKYSDSINTPIFKLTSHTID